MRIHTPQSIAEAMSMRKELPEAPFFAGGTVVYALGKVALGGASLVGYEHAVGVGLRKERHCADEAHYEYGK